ANLTWFRRHSSSVQGPYNWVTSSGVKGLTGLSVTLSKEPHEGGTYTVRLYFAEPDALQPGERVFRVLVQGREVLKDFDIVKESGGPRRSVVREFRGVAARGELTLTFQPSAGDAVLCGVELHAEAPEPKK